MAAVDLDSSSGSSSFTGLRNALSDAKLSREQLEQMPVDEVQRHIEDLRQRLDFVQHENDLFERFIKRVEAKEGPEAIKKIVTGPQVSDRLQRQRKRSRQLSSTERVPKLTAEQKCEIATKDIAELTNDIDRFREKASHDLEAEKAKLEEAELRIGEIKKFHYELQRYLASAEANEGQRKIVTEKIVRYFDDKMKSREALIEKIRLKNSALKVQRRKVLVQLRQKEELGESFHAVDYDQMKIENRQFQEKIEERNHELLQLKVTAGNTLQVLNREKKKLATQMKEANRLEYEIKQRLDLLARVEAEATTAEKERAQAEEINRRLKQRMSDYRVPEVMDYVQQNASLYELSKTVRSWERKVEIAQMALQAHQKKWRQVQQESRTRNPWNAGK